MHWHQHVVIAVSNSRTFKRTGEARSGRDIEVRPGRHHHTGRLRFHHHMPIYHHLKHPAAYSLAENMYITVARA